MTAKEIENQPAFPCSTDADCIHGPTFFQECVKANVAAMLSDNEWNVGREQVRQDMVAYAVKMAEETCKQLAERERSKE